jgi:hypothetical protein
MTMREALTKKNDNVKALIFAKTKTGDGKGKGKKGQGVKIQYPLRPVLSR